VRPASWYRPVDDINFKIKIGFAIFWSMEKVRDDGRT